MRHRVGWGLGLLLAGCATSGAMGDAAARGCFDAANGRLPAEQGVRICSAALTDSALPEALRAATLVNRGIINMQAERLGAALADYDAAILAAPGNADARINKGIALLHVGGRDAEAVAVLTEALLHNPARPELAYYHRAIANEALGRIRAAYDDYAEAAQRAPDWAEPAQQLQRFKFVRRKTLTG